MLWVHPLGRPAAQFLSSSAGSVPSGRSQRSPLGPALAADRPVVESASARSAVCVHLRLRLLLFTNNAVALTLMRSQRPHRNPDPIRPAIQLVRELVEDLFRLEQRNEPLDVARIAWQERGPWPFQVSREKRRPSVPLPFAAGPRPLPPALDHRPRVRERAQHPRNVAQRTVLATTLDQRLRRLALEVDDHELAGCGAQYLAEV